MVAKEILIFWVRDETEISHDTEVPAEWIAYINATLFSYTFTLQLPPD